MKIILIFVCLAIGETICDRPKRSRGGMQISIEDAPYFVSLRRDGRHVCGGAFVHEKHILTAARCVLGTSMEPLYETTVVSGTNAEYRTDVGEPIRDIFPHEDFAKGCDWCDIAVVRLLAKVEWSEIRQWISLPDEEPEEDDYAEFIAFEDYTSKRKNAILLQLTVVMDPEEETPTNATHRDYMIYGVPEDGQSSTNPTDRGGPLVYGKRLVGIASKLGEPDPVNRYFIKVFKFKDFIEDSMAKETSSTSEHSSELPSSSKRRRL